ncbi:MAG: hypothetical protein PHN57_06755, partial [Candidatus Omnitrophica bacterium]|nr:hypothetical protein [Candidatus Omnitrophota bacterium]
PDRVWQRIRDTIEAGQNKQRRETFSFAEAIFRPFLSIRKPVFAAIAAAAVFLVTATFTAVSINSQIQLNKFFLEQTEFLNNLGAGAANSPATNHTGFGTALEEYFL